MNFPAAVAVIDALFNHSFTNKREYKNAVPYTGNMRGACTFMRNRVRFFMAGTGVRIGLPARRAEHVYHFGGAAHPRRAGASLATTRL